MMSRLKWIPDGDRKSVKNRAESVKISSILPKGAPANLATVDSIG